ncbi:asparagine synthase (glutamine-hydrolyzing) (plasmid) [Sinorhizobium numidicum]|uniref:asparagine synthase (glutamine-hydrolyzing) n=1 Tax=Sinorhizobium numidicum TaxID=680248 RepID=A0ABY8D8D0_9HYPH|nr:asparagine synthase (glutamine-hydrolyzing) [Sinorhizobium numidicum]WEX79326.1 asparagine synthase (glutamine-hydrolyzing) [Sinorhizobium numidicum]WEX85303.1 asparagine synthase (glutamine-hydrolyzing) [Sinorhizobium numidicum]
MCGIFGLVNFTRGDSISAKLVRKCTDALAHRGPDGVGVYVDEAVGFGHRRLAIIDVDDRSNQPFVDPECNVVLTYNGEIFNYRDLHAELKAAGYHFRSSSDTEVLCKAFHRWGMDCLQRLRGMFAFGLYDRSSGRSFLVRDRMGIKPLYYMELSGRILFASQPSAILRWPETRTTISIEAISSFLSFRAVYGDGSFFERIKKVPPGHYLEIANGCSVIHEWWQLSSAKNEDAGKLSLREQLGDSVTVHTVSDVPVAALLSGGIDSSIIISEIAQRTMLSPICFTGAVVGDGYDESPYARSVAAKFGLEHRVVEIPPPDDVSLVSQLIALRCHPLGMHNEVAMFALARAVSAEHKVVLTGEGADELFAGYSRLYRLDFDYARARLLAALPSSWSTAARKRLGIAPFQPSQFDFFLRHYCHFPEDAKLSLFNKNCRSALADAGVKQASMLRDEFEEAGDNLFSRVTQFLLRHHLPALLEMVDNTTMAAGIEARVPFVDDRVIGHALSLPKLDVIRWRSIFHLLYALCRPITAFSERADTTKVILRDLYRNALPAEVLKRRKVGFALPLGKWATSEASSSFRRRLFSSCSASEQFFDMDAVREWYRRSSSSPNDAFGKQVWLLCNLELFLQQHV